MAELTLSRAASLLEGASRRRVLVVGDLMVDRYVSGPVERISPEAPVPVVRVEHEWSAVGGAANVAANVAALGASCAVVGCAGRDAAGDELVASLAGLGVEAQGVIRTPMRPTTVKTRILARRQQVVRVDREADDDLPAEVLAELADRLRTEAARADVVILEDYDKGVLAPPLISAALGEARRRGIPVVVDPKRRRFFGYAGADVFKPNLRELGDALGEPVSAEDAAWMEDVRRRLDCGVLLLTLGERGMALQASEGGFTRIPAVARAVYDVSGAGDTVTAVMALAMAGGASPEEGAYLANHAAAVEVGKAGVATVSPSEILEHVAGRPDGHGR